MERYLNRATPKEYQRQEGKGNRTKKVPTNNQQKIISTKEPCWQLKTCEYNTNG
jgi:hypothetical protein